MPDFAAIGAILSSVKTATDITKSLRDVDVSLEKAELKLKLAELMEALADVRMEAVGVQDEIDAKTRRIEELEIAFSRKDNVVRWQDAYYEVRDGKAYGRAFCARCWDVDHKLFHVAYSPEEPGVSFCAVCKTKFDGRSTRPQQS